MTGTKHDDVVAAAAARWKDHRGSLIMALHEVQDHFGYVPRDKAMELAGLLDVPLARIYEVITFYHYFKLEEPGRYRISLCMGTACYLKGADQILAEIKSLLNIEDGGVTPDKLFQLDVVRCLGCCGLAPAMMIGERVYGKLRKEDVAGILAEYQKK